MTIEFEDYKKKRVRGSIVAFIRGKKNMNWVMGIIKGKWGIKNNELEEIFGLIPHICINYDNILFEKLKQKCFEEGLIRKK